MKKPNLSVPSYDFNECELQKALKRKDNIDHLGVILKASTLLKIHRLQNPPPQKLEAEKLETEALSSSAPKMKK